MRAMEVLNQLDELGVRLSIDDFGTGYSSLAYLKDLPVDEVKIDRSFIFNMDKDPRSLAIVHAMINLGHQLDLHVVAEGIENQESLDIITAYGCDAVQGYHISKPLPAEKIMQVIESWNSSHAEFQKRRELNSSST